MVSRNKTDSLESNIFIAGGGIHENTIAKLVIPNRTHAIGVNRPTRIEMPIAIMEMPTAHTRGFLSGPPRYAVP
jgi:hypothetical protein